MPPSVDASQSDRRWWAFGLRILAVALLLAGVLVLREHIRIDQRLAQLDAWIRGLGPWGPLGIILLQLVLALFALPASVVSMASGIFFGLTLGTLYAFVGAACGAIVAFALARVFARDWMQRRLDGYERLEALNRAVAKEGLALSVLMRLTPVVPYNVVNYSLALSRIGWRDYLLGVPVLLPGTFFYVYCGHLVGNLAEAGTAGIRRALGPWQGAFLGAAVLLTAGATLAITRRLGRALQRDRADAGDQTPPTEPSA
ncbi:MAG: TVP38/TMEM64 family protein [Planctomycetota bacterium]